MKPDTRPAAEVLRERAERLLANGRMPSMDTLVHAVRKVSGDERLTPVATRRHGVVWVVISTREIGSTSQDSREIAQVGAEFLRQLDAEAKRCS